MVVPLADHGMRGYMPVTPRKIGDVDGYASPETANRRITAVKRTGIKNVVAQLPISLDAKRAELEAVLGSDSFMRAPTLAHLLSYLCEKTYAGESDQIKEYSIGLDVFHRGADFEQESDSIVRVQANRLRKRLAEYYAREGACHSIHISIPIGQYVPSFEEVAPPVEPPSRDVTSEPVPLAARVLASVRRRSWLWFSGLLLLAAVGIVFVLVRPTIVVQKAELLSNPQTVQPVEPIGLPAGDELRLLAGDSRSYVDHAGKMWIADTYFIGGSAVKSQVQHIWRTPYPSFYRSSREGEFRYDLPLKKGIYELHLHFAETFFGPENIGGGGEGSRRFNVSANGRPLLQNFDVVADAGGSSTADVKVFPDISPAEDGKLHLTFASNDGSGKAMISAIEVVPGVRGRIRPIRILARQTPYYSNDSQWWSPDAYYKGGQLATDTVAFEGTDDPELYESHRWGNFSYAIPVAPGRYSLALYFSADSVAHGNAGSQQGGPSADQVFNVFCNHKAILENFTSRSAGKDIVVRRFSDLEPDAQGKLILEFVPIKGYATVTGIEILAQ